jgi:hypothetical protein
MLKENDVRDHPIRRVKFRKSHEHQALQISDILIGAIAFRLNRSYDQPIANKDKKLICDYVFKKTASLLAYQLQTKEIWGASTQVSQAPSTDYARSVSRLLHMLRDARAARSSA